MPQPGAFHTYKDLDHRRVLLWRKLDLAKTFAASKSSIWWEWHKAKKDDFFKVVCISAPMQILLTKYREIGRGKSSIAWHGESLSMQHLYIKLAEKNIANQHNEGEMPESIIPLTPSYRFAFTALKAQPTSVLICNILCRQPQFDSYQDELDGFLKMWCKVLGRTHQ